MPPEDSPSEGGGRGARRRRGRRRRLRSFIFILLLAEISAAATAAAAESHRNGELICPTLRLEWAWTRKERRAAWEGVSLAEAAAPQSLLRQIAPRVTRILQRFSFEAKPVKAKVILHP